MAVVSDKEYEILLRLRKFDWNIEFFNDPKRVKEISKWAGVTLGYRNRDLNPYTFEYDGRWDGGIFTKPIDDHQFWIAFRDDQDYLMYKLKFST